MKLDIAQTYSKEFLLDNLERTNGINCSFESFTLDFIRENLNLFDHNALIFYFHSIGELVLCKQLEVDWYWITHYKTLSEDFIREFKDKVNWKVISEYQTLSDSFRAEFEHLL